MAKQTQVILTDDIDGSAAAETVTFGIDGTSYEIDLNADNASKLRSAVQPFIDSSRRVGRSTGTAGKRTKVKGDAAAIRAWAASKGIKTPERGRIPQNIREQYEAEN